MTDIRIQAEDFSMQEEWSKLRSRLGAEVGALAAFVGLVRDVQGDGPTTLTLEHYPGMTERSIAAVVAEAERRWPLAGATVIHRVGRLRPTDQIVLVLAASPHRAAALAACAFIIDCLKTDAVFWKKEAAGDAARWVQASGDDLRRAAKRKAAGA